MNRNKILYIVFGLIFSVGLYVALTKYYSPPRNILNAKTEVMTTADEISLSFLNNEEVANQQYTNKVLEITGIVKDITYTNSRNTIILYGNQPDSNVICDVEIHQQNEVKKRMINNTVKIKGVCKGLLKDVIILNCILINTPENE